MSRVCKSPITTGTGVPNNQNFYTVSLVKREQTGFGFLLQQREEIPYFRIWELCKNGAAEETNKIHKGDLLVKVNNHDLTTMSYEKGLEYIKSIKPGTSVALTLLSAQNSYFGEIYESQARKPNGFMSPLMKIKKKIHACTSPSSNSKQMANLTNTSKLYSSSQELEQCEKLENVDTYANGSSKYQLPIANGYGAVGKSPEKVNLDNMLDKGYVRFQREVSLSKNGKCRWLIFYH